jgi:acetyl-CoA carboxylase carboxyl transferase subunit beta
VARIEEQPTVLGVMDFAFRGGSMGSVVGEKFVRAAHDAIERCVPLVTFAASGGARMEEGILSLMQMAKTAGAVHQLNEARIPYISVLTDPTTGGVFASFASIADFVFAEPNAHIGFAGPRLIKGALKVDVPKGFQTTEYQSENGFIDRIVPRSEIRPLLGRLLQYVKPQ